MLWDEAEIPLYQQLAERAKHLRELGMSYRAIGRALGVDYKVASAVAFAIDRGAHPPAIQERMGHSSINTTLNVYGGLFPRLEEAIADALDELYDAAGETHG